MKNKLLKIMIMIFTLMLVISNPSSAYEINTDEPMADKSQVIQFLKDRNASDEMLDNVDFIYEYSEELGIDPTIVIAISSLETGYGKSNLFRNYNNPGGIKSKNGWAKFKTTRDGYKYMIRLLATYSGKINKNSWLYDKAHTTQELGNYYWVENGCDSGYHKQLTIVINKILSYPLKKEKKVTKQEKKQETKIEENKITESVEKEDTKQNKLQQIMNRKKESKNPLTSILNNRKDSNGSGMDLIKNSLNK